MVSGKLRQLPAHVRNAPPMQTALRILASVQNNDPTSFFRELRKADYLTACLMHKHIDQVRERGLQARERHPRARLSLPSLPHPPDFLSSPVFRPALLHRAPRVLQAINRALRETELPLADLQRMLMLEHVIEAGSAELPTHE